MPGGGAIEAKREQQVRRFTSDEVERQYEIGRRHTNDRLRAALDINGPPDDRRVAAKPLLPDRVRDDDRRAPPPLVLWSKSAPECGLAAQDTEGIGRE